MLKLRTITAAILALLAVSACRENSAAEADPMLPQTKTIVVSSQTSSISLMVMSEGEWKASTAESWIRLDRKEGSGSQSIKATVSSNDGFQRAGRILVSDLLEELVDTVLVKQYGKAVTIEFASSTCNLSARESEVTIPLTTNLPAEEIGKITFSQGEASDWLQVSLEGTTLSLDAQANQTGKARTAVLSFLYDNGWQTKVDISIVQPTIKGNESTKSIDVQALKSKISSATGTHQISANEALCGIVISDPSSANNAMNPHTGPHKIDYSVNAKTAYVESEDGSEGVLVRFDNDFDNILTAGDRVTIYLKGLTLVKEGNPARYSFSGVTSANIISIEKASVPAKAKRISQLTDADMYTYVTLTDCELGVKKGSYTPINEGYCMSYNATRVDTYPNMVIDREGNSIFMMVNIGCPWRRDGSGVKQGSGTISGIIVNDNYKRFEKDGNIGAYQIRPLDEAAIDFEFYSSVSVTIAEWNKYQASGDANIGSGKLTHSAAALTKTVDYGHKGPITGVQSEDSKGTDSGSYGQKTWWVDGKGCYYLFQFSTKSVTSGILSTVFTQQNTIGAPRYWAIEVSSDKTNWTRVKEYTVPDVVNWESTLYEQVCGFKSVSAVLPSSMLGKDNVYVRLLPVRSVCGTASGYDTAVCQNATNSYLSYFAIRNIR